jgi:hypothetical protein
MFRFAGFENYARDDLLEYRQHYPSKRDDPTASDNIRFYLNQIPAEPEHVTIEEILATWPGNYRHLESCHSYIQWLFPIQEKGLNYRAQVLMRHEIPLIVNSPEAMGRVLRSFAMMCDFYGMKVTIDVGRRQCSFARNTLEGGKQIWIKCYRNLNSSSHNYLRITRILKCLGELGLEFVKVTWLRFFAQEIFVTGALGRCRGSFADYWVGTIYDDAERAAFVDWYQSLKKAPGSAPAAIAGYYYESFRSDDDEDSDNGRPPSKSAASSFLTPGIEEKKGDDLALQEQSKSSGTSE